MTLGIDNEDGNVSKAAPSEPVTEPWSQQQATPATSTYSQAPQQSNDTYAFSLGGKAQAILSCDLVMRLTEYLATMTSRDDVNRWVAENDSEHRRLWQSDQKMGYMLRQIIDGRLQIIASQDRANSRAARPSVGLRSPRIRPSPTRSAPRRRAERRGVTRHKRRGFAAW